MGSAGAQFLLGHTGLLGQGFLLRFRRLHPILQLFHLSLTGIQVLRQLRDRRMRGVVRVAETRDHENCDHDQNPLTGIRLLRGYLIAFIGHTLFLLRKLKE
ncbi:MAG: hypothetical protein DMG79_00030 [Acidobacteria bacterium]|nr:MAG: hypothetical protein DMG79_00030 [Acidobacteriota bacterium]